MRILENDICDWFIALKNTYSDSMKGNDLVYKYKATPIFESFDTGAAIVQNGQQIRVVATNELGPV